MPPLRRAFVASQRITIRFPSHPCRKLGSFSSREEAALAWCVVRAEHGARRAALYCRDHSAVSHAWYGVARLNCYRPTFYLLRIHSAWWQGLRRA